VYSIGKALLARNSRCYKRNQLESKDSVARRGTAHYITLNGPAIHDRRCPGVCGPAAPDVTTREILLTLYAHSLTLALAGFFVFSFMLHAGGGVSRYNAAQLAHGQPAITFMQYLGTAAFWFESLQNWQSESLALGVMVVLSIVLRQQGSPASKPVPAPHGETGRA
jgi:hypothetical protein